MNPDPKVIAFGQEAVRELSVRLDELQTEWADVNSKRNAWLLILGEDASPKVEADSVALPETNPPNPPKDIISATAELIAGTADAGFKPRHLTSKLERMGFIVPTGFVSNRIFRMKRKGELVEQNGKYFRPNFDPRLRLYIGSAKDQGATEVTP